jgi:TolA-binding protein
MSQLSESLRDLASRLERLEDSAEETANQELKTFQELKTNVKRQKSDIQKAGGKATKEAQRWWSDTKGAIEGQISAMRANIDQFEREFKRRAK